MQLYTCCLCVETCWESKSVQCQTSLTWVFSERPLRTTESNVRSTGGHGSVSAGTQASSGFHASPLSVLRRRIRVQPIPPKRPLGVPPIPQKWHLRVQQVPDESSSSRCSLTKLRMDGVLVDVEAKSSRQAEHGGEEPSSLQPTLCPARWQNGIVINSLKMKLWFIALFGDF